MQNIKAKRDVLRFLSLARDLAESTGQWAEFKKLTAFQNGLYLQHPQGHFPSMHIKAEKITLKQDRKTKGTSFFQQELKNCGYK